MIVEHKVRINDVTLRDGEQTYGVVFSNREKLTIAKYLSDMGVHQIEVGFPSERGYEQSYLKALVKERDAGRINASLLGWHRPIIKELQTSIDLGLDSCCASISTSDIMIEHKLMKTKQWVLDTEAKAVEYAKSKGMYVSANAEDSTRTGMDFLLKFAKVVRDAGADRLRFCDTVGYVDPVATYDMVKTIIDEVGIDIEMHCHNDMGMAVANSLAGVRAGAGWIGATMNGLGERAGNAALEEVVMALKITMGVDVGIDTTMFKEVCDYVALASHCELPIWKPIIGERVFSHASGIHADGVIKDPRNYETFLPEDVGMSGRRINIGKHSGMAAVRNRYGSIGIELTEQEARELLEILRVETVELKRTPTAGELRDVYEEYKRNKKGIS